MINIVSSSFKSTYKRTSDESDIFFNDISQNNAVGLHLLICCDM